MELVGILDWPTKLDLYRAFVESKGLGWEQLTNEVDESCAEIRDLLFEFDIHFGDITDNGIFAQFEDFEKTGSPIIDERQIETALHTPPQDSRAKLRGKWIERLSQRADTNRCSWEGIYDERGNRWFHFDDPLGLQEAGWVPA